MKECWCGNKDLTEYTEHYYKCGRCGTLVCRHDFSRKIYEVNDDENDFYGKGYWESDMAEAAGKTTLSGVVDFYLSERVVYWLKYILKYVKLGADAAEIGCGLGQLAYVLRRIGYNQAAYELSPGICNYMRQELKIHVHCGSFEEKHDAYDAVLAFDVLEHMVNPKEFLEQCFGSLREQGVLCIQMPCFNPDWSYDEMLEKGPRFQSALREEQHIYLYSRAAAERLLKSIGFRHIAFEPAFFGDDYDMFLFASKEPVRRNEEQEIEDYLNAVPNGRLAKAMIHLFDEKQDYMHRFQAEQESSAARLEQVKQLTEMLKESEADRAARLEQVQCLTKMLGESEADRAARLEQIERLTKMLKESEADRAARLEQIERLTEMLKESEADRSVRLEQIESLTKMLKESEANR